MSTCTLCKDQYSEITLSPWETLISILPTCKRNLDQVAVATSISAKLSYLSRLIMLNFQIQT